MNLDWDEIRMNPYIVWLVVAYRALCKQNLYVYARFVIEHISVYITDIG